MRIRLFVLLTIGTVVLLPAGVATPTTCTTPVPCESSASSAGGTLMVCPAGDGPTLASIGAEISVTVLYCVPPEPVVGMYQNDLWIQTPLHPDPRICGGSLSSNADGPTDENGQTTISGSIAAGGYWGDGVYVAAYGVLIGYGQSVYEPYDYCDEPLPIVLVSPDINVDLVVDLADLSLFAQSYPSPQGAADPAKDFNGDGQIDTIDLSMLAMHYMHECE